MLETYGWMALCRIAKESRSTVNMAIMASKARGKIGGFSMKCQNPNLLI